MKKFLRDFLTAMLVVAGGVGAVAAWAWSTTRPPSQVSHGFVEAWANEDYATALSLGTPGFQDSVHSRLLAQRREQWRITDAEAIDWLEVTVVGNIATALLLVPYSDDIRLPVELTLRKLRDEWAVQAVAKHGEGVSITVAPGWPAEDELAARAARLLQAFAEDAPSGDFQRTHRLLAWDFQQQMPPEKFTETFRPFIGIDGLGAATRNMPAEFAEMSLDFAEQKLTLVGRFRSVPMNVAFETGWVLEGFSVRPLGLFVSLKQADEEAAP